MKRCVIALCGESFRTGGQNSRAIGGNLSYESQKSASLGIVRLCDMLEKNGYDPIIISETYRTEHTEDLKQWLFPHLYDFSILSGENEADSGIQWRNVKKVLSKAYEISPEADFVFLTRHDMILKDFFYQTFDPNWDRIMWPCITWKVWDRTPLGNPRVVDTMHFIPGKYVQKFLKLNYFGHDIWDFISPIVGYDSMGFMVNTQHDSDPAKDWNPLYLMAGRPEANGPTYYP
jgi:hypothetical protein